MSYGVKITQLELNAPDPSTHFRHFQLNNNTFATSTIPATPLNFSIESPSIQALIPLTTHKYSIIPHTHSLDKPVLTQPRLPSQESLNRERETDRLRGTGIIVLPEREVHAENAASSQAVPRPRHCEADPLRDAHSRRRLFPRAEYETRPLARLPRRPCTHAHADEGLSVV